MLRSPKEEETMFFNIIRWIVLAILIGVAAGALSGLFINAIGWGSKFATH